ncbi:hypothetical protein K1T71_014395 [Dendrolimus kikuchii]|uniref:Uncharacterized protein n=1 Tax=Dendrolimus kikuchii TaxID=765133 RepID=A0ACC1CDY2_9NEOP|nr:hypothetical protein K1T71_014395 [Dendrolimus kikuchii]
MRLFCFWCLLMAPAAWGLDDYYAPQTFGQNVDGYQKKLLSPARRDVSSQGSHTSWPAPPHDGWRENNYGPRVEPWRTPYVSKEQQASILHHKQALTSEGSFRFEYASDNGLAAGEVIEPDGSRIGGYQYKDPNGQLVKLKYRAGKDGFQILEGSHLPKSPEPVPPPIQDNHYQEAYALQRQQYDLQQNYNQQRPDPQTWRQDQGYEAGQKGSGAQYYSSISPHRDDGQYRDNEVDQHRGPHSFGSGYAFAFQGKGGRY